jgi:hypothetical protein
MGKGRIWVRAGVAALAISGVAAFAPGASALEPGVHVDPGSPAAKEYALPLSQARQTGSEPSSHTSSEGTLFGAGIKPPGAGGPPRSGDKRPGASGRSAAQGGGGSSAATGAGGGGAAPGVGPSPLSQPALAEAVLRAARAQGSAGGDGSILALLGGGVAVLVLGVFGGTVLRHSRRRTSSP